MYVLMIEDNEDDYLLVNRHVARLDDVQIEWRNSVETGLAFVAAHAVDLMLLDMSLPDGDGLFVLEQVQTQFPALPIIILSGNDADELALEAVRHGAQDYLVKDRVDAVTLGRSLRYAVERKKLEERVHQSDELYRTLARNFPNGALILYDQDLRYKLIDGLGMGELGLSKAEMEGKTLREIFPEEVVARAEPRLRAVLAGESLNLESEYAGQNLLTSYVPIRDSSGRVTSGMIMIQNITQQKRAEARFRALLESAPDAMLIIDQTGTIVLVNNETESMFGYDRAELIGSAANTLAPAPLREDPRYHVNFVEEPEAGEQAKSQSYYALRKDGSQFPVEIRVNPIETEDGVLVVMALRDVTERRQAEQQAFQLANERARVQILSDFVRDTSHDFRTPLTTINTSLYILARTTDAEKQKSAVARAEGQISRLTQLIDRLLVMSRLDTETALILKPIDVNRLLADFGATLGFDAKPKAITVRSVLPESPLMIRGDAQELSLALAELGKNALWYTPEAGTVTVRALQQGNQVIIEVADTGIGIPREEFTNIFQRLYRVDKARSSETGGSGLGLSIVNRIVELHNGIVTVDSVVGEGSAFRLFLPLSE